MLLPDPSLTIYGPDGRPQSYIPFRLAQQYVLQRMPHGAHRAVSISQPGAPLRQPNGSTTPVSASSSSSGQQQRPMLPPHAVPQARISSNGIMRPPSTPAVPVLPSQPSLPLSSPPAMSNGSTSHEQTNNSNLGADIEMKIPVAVSVHPVPQTTTESTANHDMQSSAVPVTSPMRAKTQTPSMTAIPNGFTIPAVNNYSTHITNGASFTHPGVRANGMNPLLKSAFASLTPGADNSMQVGSGHIAMRPSANSYIGHTLASGPNYSAQLAAARQMQWALAAQQQRGQAMGVVDANGIDTGLGGNISPPISGTPARVPSANGNRPLPLNRGMPSPALAQAIAAGQGRSSPANAHVARLASHAPHSPNLLSPGLVNAQPQQSPPRPPQSHMPSPSPSLQARQIVGSSGF